VIDMGAAISSSLRELQFASLGGDGVTMEPAMRLALDANFGSFERWREDFVKCASARDSAWTLLAFQSNEGTLTNQWSNDHTHPRGVPILALDTRDRDAARIDEFLGGIDWARVYERYQAAVQ